MATDRCSSKGEEISRPFEARLSSNRVGKDVGPERIKHFRLDKVSLNKSMENVLKVLHSLAQAEEKTHISFWYIDQLVREKDRVTRAKLPIISRDSPLSSPSGRLFLLCWWPLKLSRGPSYRFCKFLLASITSFK